MCNCLSFLIAPWRFLHRHFNIQLFSRQKTWSVIYPAEHVEIFTALDSGDQHACRSHLSREIKFMASSTEDTISSTMIMAKKKQQENIDCFGNLKRRKLQLRADVFQSTKSLSSSGIASFFTKQGEKGINQDAMLIIEDFASLTDTVLCGVFDGHGPHGHHVARIVAEILPGKLLSCWRSIYEAAKLSTSLGDNNEEHSPRECIFVDDEIVKTWKDCLIKAYKVMDRELLLNDHIDCISSGTTAVTLVKHGNRLIVGNVGDSRAILASMTEDGSHIALQLTVDLKPDIPSEAERIKRFKGRVFALRNEPSVKRVWLPRHNTPGLAMSRALGDYCLKNYGVISEPDITYRRLTKKDKFVVLATDGIWDVLSNKQVVDIAASTPVRSQAGKAVVDAAIKAWKTKYVTSKVDDCAVICLFLDSFASSSK